MPQEIKKVVLAYSGGLDTSVILKWLQTTYNCEVVTFTADLGQGEELEPARAKAEMLGIKEIYIDDLREEFVRDFVFPMFRANAVYEGADAVMLSGETAIGRNPVAVIRTMARVAARAESEASYQQWANKLGKMQREFRHDVDAGDQITMALSRAASEAAIDADVAAILCCTRSGRTARAMARFRPVARMVGLSPDPKVVRTMALTWGIEPIKVDTYSSTDEMVWFAVETAMGHGVADHGDTVIVLAGAPTVLQETRAGLGHKDVATDVLRLVCVD